MAKALWNGTVIAESDSYELVEGNVYFPPGSIRSEYFTDSDMRTVCHWKGTASYYHVTVAGKEGRNVAWYYPEPKEAAGNIKDYIAFWRGVVVEK